MRLASTTKMSPRGKKQSQHFSKTTPLTSTPRNIKDFTPIQQFQKYFSDLDKHLIKFRQLNPPQDFNQLFEDFSDLKTRQNLFIENANKIIRHIKLGNSPKKISERPYEICGAFPGEISRFFSYFMHIKSKITLFFSNAFQRYYTRMEKSFNEYAELCLKQQQTRYIYLQYESTIMDLFVDVQEGLNFVLPHFTEIQDSSEVIESLKALSRKFESELPHSLHSQRLMMTSGQEQLVQFHDCFVAIVPMLSNIPTFNQIFNDIADMIDPLQQLVNNILQQLQIDTPHILTAREIQESVTSEDLFHISPTDHFIQELSQKFGAGDGEGKEPTKWHEEIYQNIQKIITDLEQRNHQLQTKLKSYEKIKSEKSLNERIEENRKFKESVIQEFEEKRIDLMRNVINTAKILVPFDMISTSDNFETQFRCIISNAELEQKVAKENLNDAKETINQAKDILINFLEQKFYLNVDKNLPLPSVAELAIDKFSKQQVRIEQKFSNESPGSTDLNTYLKKFLTKHKITPDNLATNTQLKKEMKKYVGNLEFKLNESEEKLSKLKESYNQFEEKVVEYLSKIQRQLATFNNDEPIVTDVSFESLSKSIDDLLSNGNKRFQESISFRNFLTSFLAQLLYSFKLQQPKFRGITEEQLKDVMTNILDTPQVQKGLVSGNANENNSKYQTVPNIVLLNTANNNNSANNITTPKTIRGAQSTRTFTSQRTKEIDTQFTLKMHSYLSDCCAQLNGASPVQYLHQPVEKLMQDVTKSIYEKNECLLNYKGLVADIYIRLANDLKKNKEALMKSPISTIASGIFTKLEEIVENYESNTPEKIKQIVNLINDEDLRQFYAMNLKPLQIIKGELEKIQRSHEIVLPIIQYSEEVEKDLDKTRLGFVPSSPHFKHYMDSLEQIRRSSLMLTSHEIHPTIFQLASKLVELVDNFSTIVTAVSANDGVSGDDSQFQTIIDSIINKKELDDKIDCLQNMVIEKSNEADKIKKEFSAFLAANRKKWDDQVRALTEIHQNEINQIVEYYEAHQIF